MVTRNAKGQTIRVHSYSSPMRKHGGDAQRHQDATLAALDAVAHGTSEARVSMLHRRAGRVIDLRFVR